MLQDWPRRGTALATPRQWDKLGSRGEQLVPSANPVLTRSRPVLVAQGIGKVLNA